MSLLLIISGITVGAVAIIFLMRPKPLHIRVPPMEVKVLGINIFPLTMWMAGLMTEGMRKKAATKQNAPKLDKVARDLYDVTGDTPYKIEEVKPGKIWQITYATENMALTDKEHKKAAAASGMDPSAESYRKKCLDGAATFGEKAVEVAKKDLDTALKMNIKDSFTDEELIETMEQNFILNSFIVKLDNGSLLWYCPVRIREEVGFGSWLDSLGKVDWIIVASSFHTLNIKFATDRYPNAKVVGAPAAQDKLNFINALPRNKFDYNCTNANDLKAANDILEKDGEGFCSISKERFGEFRPEDWFLRLFKFAMMSKPNVPHGFLPIYRYSMMYPTGIGALSYDKPAGDGSTCRVMAASLRKMMRMEFASALGVHGNIKTREQFRNNIEVNWNWLDGQSLL